MNTESVVTVGEAASSFFMYALWGAPLMQVLDLIYPFIFSFRKISYESACWKSSLVWSSDAVNYQLIYLSCHSSVLGFYDLILLLRHSDRLGLFSLVLVLRVIKHFCTSSSPSLSVFTCWQPPRLNFGDSRTQRYLHKVVMCLSNTADVTFLVKMSASFNSPAMCGITISPWSLCSHRK